MSQPHLAVGLPSGVKRVLRHADLAYRFVHRTPLAGSAFQTNPFDLDKLLENCHRD
jgi:hypothetical protein